MQARSISDLARSLYTALAAGDRHQLDALLHPDFVGHIAEGMPFGIGGQHDGPAAMRRNGWGGIARHFAARAEAERFLEIGNDHLLVTGRYRGQGKQGGAPLNAAFAHFLTFEDGRIRSLEQYTDTARWRDAASPARTVLLDFADGVATLRLNRPEQSNAINEEMAKDLGEAVSQLVETSGVRAVLICANGPNFTMGGDVSLFAGTAPEQLPHKLRRMIDAYHLAIERLTGIDAPIVAAVRGAAAGGGLGLLYAADIAVAAADARFVLGYGGLGLTSDGGNTWFLPRMVGLRRAQELFLLNSRLSAQDALDYGLVSRLVPDDVVEAEAAGIAAKLASGPTRAYGAMRRMLRQSFETSLTEQLLAENDSIVRAAGTDDAQEGIASFAAKRRPQFRGR
ncbi:enoyl-CoA hydratase/isomerase family protein [Bradyrhizobium tropiciagri]|uniref:enoyl-CoA hydratase-related protein n=1 Tax=Bradyrhizobium tropiciagri TaxID=312253 RepID=UPI001BAB8C38|nr:enoyl-CoA hydratase-related protein [Bradyrhizobium tropiciagri]MBR0899133.1 enoyl-CoA hydratase/isomerase family protein [Bradyrhizobium tropiciagri]